MESPPSSRLIFYDTAGAIPGPVEGSTCGIAIDVPKEFRPYVTLKLDGHLLPLQMNETSVFSEWPACGPGHYELFLECGEIRERRTMTVMPRCFTATDCSSMIHDLTDVIPLTIALQLNQCGARLSALPPRDQKSTIEEEYLRLHNSIRGTNEKMGMLQILPILQRECIQILKPQLELKDVNKLRRPDISKLPQSIAIPGNLVTETKLYQMFDVVSKRSFEAYENRLVKAYVIALRSRIARLQATLRTFAPSAMAAELDAMANEFHLAYVRAGFLREVKNASISSVRVTMVLLKNPSYRAVLEGYLGLNDQSSVILTELALNAPLNQFPYLYQRWAQLKVLTSMLQVCAESGYRCVSHNWVKVSRKGTSIQAVNDGLPAVQLLCPRTGRLVSFIPWSTGGGAAGELPMGAAITIEMQGRPISFLLFDPKYWVDSQKVKVRARPKANQAANAEAEEVSKTLKQIEPHNDDVERIVRYRNDVKALTAGASEIHYGAILYPGQRKQLAPELEALPAHPNDTVGTQKNICDVLRRFLA